MFRTFILSASLATVSATGFTSSVDAQPPVNVHHHRFEVLVKHGHHWHVVGRYHHWFEAERVAHDLRRDGFRVEVRGC
ncbi:MAG: hypothetical protein U0792_00720 [Gemmataceae bacterium]